MKKQILLLSLGLTSHGVLAMCEPDPEGAIIQQAIVSGDSQGLSDHLKETANLSDDFSTSRGMSGFDEAVAGLAATVFQSDEAKIIASGGPEVPAALVKVTEELKGRVAEACTSQSDGDSDQETMKKTLAGLSGGDSTYHFLIGNVNSLEGDGSFSSGFEASFFSRTNYARKDLPSFIKWVSLGRESVVGTFDITFSEIGEIEEAEDMMSGEEGSGMMDDGQMMQSPMNDFLNPFAVGGGFFRLNASLDIGFTGDGDTGAAFRFGTGLSTQPSNSENDVSASGRGFAGVVFAANYGEPETGDPGRGEVFIGYAQDKFWEYETSDMMQVDERDRIIVDGRLNLPGFFKSENVRLVARVFADTPASGNGPSDVRVSLLVSAKINSLFN